MHTVKQTNIHLPVLHVTVVKSKICQSQQAQTIFCREVEENCWKNAVSFCPNPLYICIQRAGALLKLLSIQTTSQCRTLAQKYQESPKTFAYWIFHYCFALGQAKTAPRSITMLPASQKPRFKDRGSCTQQTMFSNRSESTLLLSYSEIVSLVLTYKSDQFSHLLHYCLVHFYGVHMHTSTQ